MKNYKRLFHSCCRILSDINKRDVGTALLKKYIVEWEEDNDEFILGAAASFTGLVQFASPELKNDPEFMLAVTLECIEKPESNSSPLKHASSTLRDNRDFITKAVQITPYALKYASRRLRKDIEIVMTAVKHDGRALQFANPALFHNKQIILTALKSDGLAFTFASPALQNDSEVIREAENTAERFGLDSKRSNGKTRTARSKSHIQDYKELFSTCCWILNGVYTDAKDSRSPETCIDFLHDVIEASEIGYDREFILKAAGDFEYIVEFMSPELKDDPRFMLALTLEYREEPEHYINPLEHASDRLKASRGFILGAVRICPYALEHASPALRRDSDFVLAALRVSGYALEYAHPPFQANKAIVLAAVRQQGGALRYASEALKQDRDVVLAACKTDLPRIFQYSAQAGRDSGCCADTGMHTMPVQRCKTTGRSLRLLCRARDMH